MRLLSLLLVMSTVLAGCHRGPPPTPGPPTPAPQLAPMQGGAQPLDWRELVGCYRMRSGDRRVFALDSARAVTRVARPGPEGRAARVDGWRYEAYWQVTPRNTVELVLHGGTWGLRYEFLMRDGGRLIGRQSSWSDMPRHEKPDRAAADRVACPAALDDRPFG